MRAVVVERTGPPEVLRVVEVADPTPGAGQVVVAVRFAGIAFVDTQVRAGTAPVPAPPLPYVPGTAVGGTVIAVGSDVDDGWLGVDVVTSTGRTGGYASRAVAAVADLHRVPATVDLLLATALLTDGRTAVGLVRAATIDRDDTVAVTAAAGGVGSLLVQLAAHDGATVVALAGSDDKLAHARQVGASAGINYRHASWPNDLIAVAPDGIDVAFDGVGGDVTAALFAHVRPGGRYLPHGAASGSLARVAPDDAAQRRVTVIPLSNIAATPADSFRLAEEAFALVGRGVIRPVVGQTYPLEAAADAHAAIEARTTVGKTMLVVSD
ncbi:MAG TPA: zinc-binding dehydrogenase [Micromonosporaceae bacterium]|nr:zinc-binding dehydrogenase [Micromonosporaceae bacterium]